jgi:hypothetical protein
MALGTITFNAIGRRTYVELIVQCPGATFVTVTRLGIEVATVVRGAEDAPAEGGLFHGYDWEAPQQVSLTYRAVVTDGTNEATVEAVMTGEINYGGDWVMPVGRAELGMVVNVEYGGVGQTDRDVIRDVATVVNRSSPMVVSWGRQLAAGSLTVLTLEDAERRRFLGIIQYPIIMFAARPNFGVEEPLFASLGTVTEERTSGLGSEPSRRWVMDVQFIARPPAVYAPPPPSASWQTRTDEDDTWGEVKASLQRWFDYAGFGG